MWYAGAKPRPAWGNPHILLLGATRADKSRPGDPADHLGARTRR